MALKTFNIDGDVYKEFSEYCKKEGISMSKRVDNFLRAELEKVRDTTISNIGENNDSGEKEVQSPEISGEHRMSKYT